MIDVIGSMLQSRPSDWRLSKHSRHFTSRMGETILREDLIPDGKIPVYSATEDDELFGYIEQSRSLLNAGDIVIPARGNCIGSVKLMKCTSTSTQTTIQTRTIDRGVHTPFVFYFFQAFRKQLFYFERTAIPQITVEQVNRNPLLLPPMEVQKQIASFLDSEIAYLNQLIEKRVQFLELVEEKKQSYHADAIEGRLVQGDKKIWPAKRAKLLFRERQDRSEDGSEELLTVSHLTGVTTRAEKDVNMFLAETNEGYKVVAAGDIVINTMWAWMGAMGVSPCRGIASPSYGVYKPITEDFEPQFLDVLLRSRPFIAEVNRRSKGVHSSRMRLYPGAFLDMQFPVPPKREQLATLQSLQEATNREERLAELSRAAISHLRELRSALIAAVVIGRINPDDWQKHGRTGLHLDQIEAETMA